jgi:hypothetical protein
MKVDVVPYEWVNKVWPLVEPFIIEALEYSDDYTVDQVKTFVTQGMWLLVTLSDNDGLKGAGTINFFNRPNARVAFVTSVSGKFVTTPEVFEQLKALAISRGATEIEGAVRESVARLFKQNFGFEEKYRIVGVKL